MFLTWWTFRIYFIFFLFLGGGKGGGVRGGGRGGGPVLIKIEGGGGFIRGGRAGEGGRRGNVCGEGWGAKSFLFGAEMPTKLRKHNRESPPPKSGRYGLSGLRFCPGATGKTETKGGLSSYLQRLGSSRAFPSRSAMHTERELHLQHPFELRRGLLQHGWRQWWTGTRV